jgi:hypothetical protein
VRPAWLEERRRELAPCGRSRAVKQRRGAASRRSELEEEESRVKGDGSRRSWATSWRSAGRRGASPRGIRPAIGSSEDGVDGEHSGGEIDEGTSDGGARREAGRRHDAFIGPLGPPALLNGGGDGRHRAGGHRRSKKPVSSQ